MSSLGLSSGALLVIVIVASGIGSPPAAIAGPPTVPCVVSPTVESTTPGVNGTGRPVGERVFAQAYVARETAGRPTREFVVFVRGAPGWHRGGSRVARIDRSTGDSARWIIETRFDALTLVGFLYPQAGLLSIGGATVALDTANVFLLDQVDGVGGPPTLRSAGCIQTGGPGDAIERAMRTFPMVREFIGSANTTER
jgi:hypothetical protein